MATEPISKGYHSVSAHLASTSRTVRSTIARPRSARLPACLATVWRNAEQIRGLTREEIAERGRAAMAAMSSN